MMMSLYEEELNVATKAATDVCVNLSSIPFLLCVMAAHRFLCFYEWGGGKDTAPTSTLCRDCVRLLQSSVSEKSLEKAQGPL
jgi:hypothetical protein